MSLSNVTFQTKLEWEKFWNLSKDFFFFSSKTKSMLTRNLISVRGQVQRSPVDLVQKENSWTESPFAGLLRLECGTELCWRTFLLDLTRLVTITDIHMLLSKIWVIPETQFLSSGTFPNFSLHSGRAVSANALQQNCHLLTSCFHTLFLTDQSVQYVMDWPACSPQAGL